jgi:hypothetical protein
VFQKTDVAGERRDEAISHFLLQGGSFLLSPSLLNPLHLSLSPVDQPAVSLLIFLQLSEAKSSAVILQTLSALKSSPKIHLSLVLLTDHTPRSHRQGALVSSFPARDTNEHNLRGDRDRGGGGRESSAPNGSRDKSTESFVPNCLSLLQLTESCSSSSPSSSSHLNSCEYICSRLVFQIFSISFPSELYSPSSAAVAAAEGNAPVDPTFATHIQSILKVSEPQLVILPPKDKPLGDQAATTGFAVSVSSLVSSRLLSASLLFLSSNHPISVFLPSLFSLCVTLLPGTAAAARA